MFVALIAYFSHFVGTCCAKFGLFLQKRLHLQIECEEAQKEDIDDTQKNEMPVYCRWQWLLGFGFLAVAVAIHTFALPYADIVLISTNMIWGIVFNTFLSIRYLDEKFIWKYDLVAFSFMGFGMLTIILIANTDEIKYTAEE